MIVKKLKFLVYFSPIVLLACATTPKMGIIFPQGDNSFAVSTSGKTKEDALSSAVYSAEQTCKKSNKSYIVLSQKVEYQGLVSESAAGIIDKATFMTSALLPSIRSNEDYQASMSFKCST
jgi:hypothetical protein